MDNILLNQPTGINGSNRVKDAESAAEMEGPIPDDPKAPSPMEIDIDDPSAPGSSTPGPLSMVPTAEEPMEVDEAGDLVHGDLARMDLEEMEELQGQKEPEAGAAAKPARIRRTRKTNEEGTRRSIRITEKESVTLEAQRKFPKNFEVEKSQDRGVVVPRGLVRTPFHFDEEKPKDRLTNQLEIAMVAKFGLNYKKQVESQSEGEEEVDEGKENQEKEKAEGKGKKKKDEECKSPIGAKGGARIRIGKNYQAVLPEWSETAPGEDYRSRKAEIQWKVWTPPPMENIMSSCLQLGEFENVDSIRKEKDVKMIFYFICHQFYWNAIWRQFKSHIPYETALSHLKMNNYNFANALETVDVCLKRLPQEMKPLGASQAQEMAKMLKIKNKTLRTIQEKAMRNYHLGEVQNYLYQFRRFYKLKSVSPCTCGYQMCWPTKFEPRVSCTNCTKRGSDADKIDATKWCLICRTYKFFSNRVRPASNVIFMESEKFFLEQWKLKEELFDTKFSRVEIKKMIKEDNEERWKNDDLTLEENEMVSKRKLRISNRQIRGRLNAEEKKLKDQKRADQLVPFEIPHLTICQCSKTKKLSEKEFSDEEVKQYKKAIMLSCGDLKRAATYINEDVEYIYRFLEVYKKDDPIWKGFPLNYFHKNSQPAVYAPLYAPRAIPSEEQKQKNQGSEEKGSSRKRSKFGTSTRWTKRKRSGKKKVVEEKSSTANGDEMKGSNVYDGVEELFGPPPVSTEPSTSGTY